MYVLCEIKCVTEYLMEDIKPPYFAYFILFGDTPN